MAIVILASCACAGYTFFFLKFKTNRAELLDPQAEFHKHWEKYSSAFEQSSQVMVVVEAGSTDEIKRILDEVADHLKREPEHFSNILCKFEAGPLQRKWLQYVKPRQLQTGLRRIGQYSPILRGDWSRIELEGLFNQLGDEIEGGWRRRPRPPRRRLRPKCGRFSSTPTCSPRVSAITSRIRRSFILPGLTWSHWTRRPGR